MPKARPPAERFWAMVQKTETCWLWLGATNPDGYGRFLIGSRTDGTRRLVQAHRWVYEQEYGPIPPGLEPDHLCDVRNCVRPSHLEAKTHRSNVRRAKMARGERSGSARLSEPQVREIRSLFQIGEPTLADLAARYGVGKSTIRYIVHGRTWKHLDGVCTGNFRSRATAGSRNAQAKLTESDILTIRESIATGCRVETIAVQFGVSSSAISQIGKRKTWAHVA